MTLLDQWDSSRDGQPARQFLVFILQIDEQQTLKLRKLFSIFPSRESILSSRILVGAPNYHTDAQ